MKHWSTRALQISLFICIFLGPKSTIAQGEVDPIFPVDDLYFKPWGWYAGLGGNYTFPLFDDVTGQVENSDTTFNYRFSGNGQLGAMIEGGAFYMLDNPIVSLLDAGLRVNWFRGKENVEIAYSNTSSDDSLSSINEDRSFQQVNLSLRLNANNTIKVSQYGFIQNTLGFNFDYRIFEDLQTPSGFPENTRESNEFQIQLHYKLAYGFRLDLMHYMIIGLDAPILTVYPWNDGRQTIDVFQSHYWPVTLSVCVLFLQKSGRPDCKKPPPLDMNKKRKEAKMF